MRSSWGFVVAVALAVGCTRDLALPPEPGPLQPGTISGRVVYAQVGSNIRRPAAGAGIEILTTSISAIADADGRFVLSGINLTDGVLLVRFDLKADGTFARQRLLRLKDISAGPGHDISLGEVSVVENAQVRGKVLRGNIVTTGGHGGTTIFVPEGPFATTSADDGSFLLHALPEGAIRLVIFRPGYKAVSLDDVELRSGEELTLRLVTLEVDPTPQTPARMSGTVSTNPPLSDLSAGSVELAAPGDPPLVASLAANGTFELAAVPAGIYTIAAKHPQYTTATLHNFLAASGGDYTLAQIVLTTSPQVPQSDAGTTQQPTGDSGVPDGGQNINANLAPIANAGPDQIVRTGRTVQLDATQSVDPENKPLRYTWVELSDAGVSLSSNNSLLAMTPTFTAPSAPKLLRFRLTVTDDGDLAAIDEVIVEAMRPPVAIIDPPNVTVPPEQAATIFFDGGMSYDPNNAPLTYAWSIGPGVALSPDAGTGKTFTVTTPSTSLGQGTVRLVVSNGFLKSDPVDARVTIGGGGNPTATVSAPADRTVGFGEVVSLTASATSNIQGSTFNYSWSQVAGGGITLSGATSDTVTFTAPSSADTLTFRVDAIGSINETGFDEVTVTVRDVTAPTIVNSVPGVGGIGSPLSATVTFNEDLLASTVTPANVRVVDSSMNVVPASVAYDPTLERVTLSYGAPLAANASYTLKVDNVTDLAGNAVASFTAAFTARSFLYPLWAESPGGSAISTLPYVLWTPSATYVVGRRQVSPLSGFSAYFMVWKVIPSNSTLDVPAWISTNAPQDDTRSGDIGPRALRTGAGWYALGGISNGSGGFPLWLYNTVGETFPAVSSWPGAIGLSDGASIWGAYENYGLNVRPHQLTMNTFGPEQKIDADCCRTGRIAGAGDGNVFYVGGWANGITPVTYNKKTWFFKNSGGSWVKFGEAGTGSPTDVLQARMRVHQGLPIVVQPESVGGNYLVRAYAWDATGMAMTELGGGSANTAGNVTSFDAAVLGDAVYVAMLFNNDLRVKYASISNPSAPWVELSGPSSGGVFKGVAGCAADRPSLDAAPDGIWLAWSESCGGTTNWKTYVRKLH